MPRRRVGRPRGLLSLVAWYAERWADEAPIRVHTHDVWHDARASSALGSPQDSPAFRRWLYAVPWETDDDGYYLRPTSAALARLAGHQRDETSERGMMALYLWRLAYGGFDWRAVGARHGLPEPVAATYTRVALEALYDVWHATPSADTMRASEDVPPQRTVAAGRNPGDAPRPGQG